MLSEHRRLSASVYLHSAPRDKGGREDAWREKTLHVVRVRGVADSEPPQRAPRQGALPRRREDDTVIWSVLQSSPVAYRRAAGTQHESRRLDSAAASLLRGSTTPG